MGAAIVMPKFERREQDAVTLVHARAAGDVHRAASWLFRGADLMVVRSRTPYLAETAEDLWKCYSEIPLDRRPDKLIAFVSAVELLSLVGVTRKEYPRLRRALDVYSGALAVACLAPKQVFYQLHLACWRFESWRVWRELKEVQMPMPSWKEGEELARHFTEAVRTGSAATGLTYLGGEDKSSRPWPVWQLMLLTSCMGVGIAAVLRGPEKFVQDLRGACDNAAAAAAASGQGVSGLLENIGLPRQEPLLPRERQDSFEHLELVPASKYQVPPAQR